MLGKSPAQRYNISLPPELAEALRRMGDGNLSAGVREALQAAKQGRKTLEAIDKFTVLVLTSDVPDACNALAEDLAYVGKLARGH